MTKRYYKNNKLKNNETTIALGKGELPLEDLTDKRHTYLDGREILIVKSKPKKNKSRTISPKRALGMLQPQNQQILRLKVGFGPVPFRNHQKEGVDFLP